MASMTCPGSVLSLLRRKDRTISCSFSLSRAQPLLRQQFLALVHVSRAVATSTRADGGQAAAAQAGLPRRLGLRRAARGRAHGQVVRQSEADTVWADEVLDLPGGKIRSAPQQHGARSLLPPEKNCFITFVEFTDASSARTGALYTAHSTRDLRGL
jgi:hypothetical protein